ncbi:XRE family transcriptional regulator [Catenulispora sp. MAP5-51]|uniref:XRE family transcriptional regulator n=1 Tax=Catenulispora sp. MAP5-51 TaxID=3156298 RepID=UPI00351989C6
MSFWQSGHRRPERSASLSAVGHLEQILGLPAGSLIALLGPPRSRRRSRSGLERPPLEAVWPEPDRVREVLERFGPQCGWDDALARISAHDRVVMNPDGTVRSIRCRQIMRAATDGPDRWMAIYRAENDDPALPRVHARHGCRLGRTHDDDQLGMALGELLFDRALRRDEFVVLDYELEFHSAHSLFEAFGRRFRLPMRQYLIEVDFHPDALPRQCQHAIVPRFEQAHTMACDVPLDRQNRIHGLGLDLEGCSYNLQWHF